MNPVLKLSSPDTHEYWEVSVVYEDDALLALDKPAGLLTYPDRNDPHRPNLMQLLHRDIQRRAAWAQQRNLVYLANAHRLDFETSGLLLLAKNKPTLVHLADQFGSTKPRNTYVALAQGAPEDSFACDAKLAPHPFQVGKVRVDEKRGKKSLTEFRVLERFQGYCLLQCQPLTGRTHQIRAHLRWLNCPVVGDELYGGAHLLLSRLKPGYHHKPNEPEKPLMHRVALHSESLCLRHPLTGAEITMTCPWPHDLIVALKYLRKFSRPAP